MVEPDCRLLGVANVCHVGGWRDFVYHIFALTCFMSFVLFVTVFLNLSITIFFHTICFICFIKNLIYLFFSSIPSKNIFIYLFFHVYFLLKFKNVCGWLIYEIIKWLHNPEIWSITFSYYAMFDYCVVRAFPIPSKEGFPSLDYDYGGK
jgi:hypothetical protein